MPGIPKPTFYLEVQGCWSTKKERPTPREQFPPKPPIKTAPPISRFVQKRPTKKAQAISFVGSETSMLSKHYDESLKESYFDQCFEIHGKLGAGSFGEVFKVKSKEDGKFYAVKRSKERFRGEADRMRKLQEVAKHEELPTHANCVQFFKAWEENGHLFIQTELCETSLSYYCEENHEIPEVLIWNYLVDLLLAIKHLHDHSLVHLDIKPANIFISKDGICKLGDFGLVLDLSKGNLTEAVEGDPKYLAAELMQSKFSKAADIFSLGITILELACDLDLPCGGEPWHDLRQGRLPFDLMEDMSLDLRQVIKYMMTSNYLKRPSVDKLLSLPVMKKVRNKRKHVLLVSHTIFTIETFLCTCLHNILDMCKLLVRPLMRLWNRNKSPTPLPTPNPSPSTNIIPFPSDYSLSDEESSDNLTVSPIPFHKMNTEIEVEDRQELRNSTPTSSRKPLRRRSNDSPMNFTWEETDKSISPILPRRTISPIQLSNRFNANNARANLMGVFEAASSDEDF